MLKLRLREYTPMGVKGKVLPVIEGTLEVTTQLNSTPRLTFSMSTIMAGKMPVDGFVVGVEYAVGNGHYQPLPQHDRFIITEDDRDNADPSKVITYTGESYAIWLLAHTYVHWNTDAVNKQRKVSSNAGGTMRHFLLESKARGWGTQFTYDFDGSKDSNGVNWVAGTDNTVVDWNLLTPLTEVLDQLHEGGLCDWSVEGTKLRLFRPETLGTDKTEKVLGKTAQRAPAKTDMSEIFTNLTVVPEKAYYWLYLDNPAAPSKYGRLEATMTQSGIESHAEATKLAQPSLLKGRTVAREESFEYNARNNDLVPWKDFSIGDRLTIISGGERVARRVIGIVAKSENGTTSVRTIVGDPINSTMKKVLKRVGAASVGDIVGGSGSSFPGNFGPAPLTPEKPDNLRLVSNEPVWLEDGTAMTTIKIAWDAVTMAVDGSTAIIEEYEVWSRTGGEFPTLDTAVINPEAVVTHWEPGTVRYVTVRARNNLGHWSEHSLELAVTPDYPTSIVPKAPTGLSVVSNVGAFTASGSVATVVLKWDAVTQSTDNTPIEIEEYEVFVNGAPLFRVEGLTTTVSLATDIVGKYRVRAKSSIGFWGDPSTEVTVTGAKPAVAVRAPTAPVLTTGAGNAFARWEGTYVSGGTLGAHSVRVEARIGAGAWVEQGTLISAGQQIIKIGAIGDTVAVRLRAYDQLGRLTGTSAESSIEVVGIPRADLDQAVNDFLDGLDELAGDAWDAASAAVKNTVTEYAVGSSDTAAPSSGWSTATPTRTPGSFIWMRSVITFGNDSTSTTSPVLVTGNDGAEGNPGAPGTPGTPGADGADGADGRGIVSTEIRYQAGSSGTTTPTNTWQTSVPTVSAGQYLWTRTTITYTSGTPSVSYSVGRMGTNGSNGTPGAPGANGQTSYLHVAYANSANGATNFSTTDPSGRAYMGTYTDFTEADSETPGDYTWALIKGANGSTGPAGKGIASSVVNYAQSTSGTTTPTSGWQTTIPSVPEGQYLWTRTRITFTDSAQTDTFTVAKQGAKGDTGATGAPGAPGVGITGTVVNYAVGSSGTSAPSSGWGTSIPSVGAGQYLWTRTVTSYSSGNPTTAYSVGLMGQNGAAGATGKGVSSTEVRYQLHSNGTTAPTGTWQTSPQTQTEALPYLWTRTVTTYTDATTSTAYSVGMRGAKGSNGATGATGPQGVSVSSVQQYYQTTAASASAPAVPTTSTPPSPWTTTEPAYAANTALWATTRVGYSNSTFSYTPVSKVSAFTAASQAQTTADGKNRVWYSNTAPPGTGHKVDDVWFDGANGNRINTWSGSAWVVRQMGTNAIADLAITNALIANGTIQNAKIANLDAAKITTGTLNAGRIAANSISAQKLLLTSLNNLAQDNSFEYNNTEAWQMVANSANETTNPRTGSRALRVTTTTSAFVAARQVAMSSVAGGERYRVSAWVRLDSGTSANNGITLRFAYASTEGGSTTSASDVALTPTGTGTTYVQISGIWTVPAAAKFARLEVISRETVAGKIYRVDDVEIYKMTTSELIVDGAVTARTISAEEAVIDKIMFGEGTVGRLQVDHVEPAFGDNLNLSANGDIVLLAGRQDELADEVAATTLTADTALTGASSAASAAAAAAAAAAIADGKALVAQAEAQSVSDGLAAQQAVFVVTPTGAEVRSADASNVFSITPAGAAIIQGGLSVSTWDGARLISNELIANRAQLANHVIEKSGTRTVIRAL